MIKGKKILAGVLAAATVLTSVPVCSVYADDVQAVAENNDVTYNTTFNVIVQTKAYTDTTFTTEGDATSGKAVASMYQTALKTFTYTGSGEAYFDFDLDVSDILSQIDLSAGGGSFELGTITSDNGGVVLDGSTLHITNARGADSCDGKYYGNQYTDVHTVKQIYITVPYSVTNQVIDLEFKGKFDHGYIPSTLFSVRFGYSSSDMYDVYFSMPATNVKEDKTKIPFMIVKGGNYPDTVETELLYLTSYYSHWNGKIIDLRTGQATSDYNIYDLGDFDKNPNPCIEREYLVDTTNYQALVAFNNVMNRAFAVNSFANGEGDSNVPVLLKVEASDPITFANTTLYKSFTVKFKASYCCGLNWEYNMAATTQDSTWSHQFGRTNSVYYVVNDQNYTRVRKYYNVYDDSVLCTGSLENAKLVKTYKGDEQEIPGSEEPTTEVEGYMYLNQSDTVTDHRAVWDYYDSKYRYFAKLMDVNLDYNIRYKVEYADGTPAGGISLNGETTGTDGFIAKTDTYSLNLRNLYRKKDDSTNYYFKTSGDYTADSVPGTTDISCEDKKYSFNLSWNYIGGTIALSKLNTFDGLLSIKSYDSIKIINDEKDAFTKIVVVKLDRQPVHYTIKVYDKYVDESGAEEKTDLRLTDTKLAGSAYAYEALNPAGYKVSSAKKYEGTCSDNLTLVFTYTKESTSDVTTTPEVRKGDIFTVGKYKYKVTGASAVAFHGIVSDKTTKVLIPKTVPYADKIYKVTSISDGALKNENKVTKVSIGANVKTIGASAFCGCKKLSKVTIGSSVTTIGSKAFMNCTALKSITIPGKVTKIEKQAFYKCKNLKTITMKSKKLKTVGKEVFKNINSTAKIKVPKSRLSAYKKLLKGKGQGSKVKIIKSK